jgi:hypothetical protein
MQAVKKILFIAFSRTLAFVKFLAETPLPVHFALPSPAGKGKRPGAQKKQGDRVKNMPFWQVI